jgi:hypothetical protein
MPLETSCNLEWNNTNQELDHLPPASDPYRAVTRLKYIHRPQLPPAVYTAISFAPRKVSLQIIGNAIGNKETWTKKTGVYHTYSHLLVFPSILSKNGPRTYKNKRVGSNQARALKPIQGVI